MLGHAMAPVMIGPAALKADFADPLNQRGAAMPGSIPCSVPEISLFRPLQEKRNSINILFSLRYSSGDQLAGTRKKRKFPVIAPEQGNSAAEAIARDQTGPPESQPDSYRPIHADQARKLCAHGLSEADIADFFDVAPAMVDRWRRTHPAFAAALVRGKTDADNQIERSLYRRAIGYDRRVEKIFTPAHAEVPILVTIRDRVPADPRAALAWLRIRRPEKWGAPREQARARREQSAQPHAAAASMPLERHQRSHFDPVGPKRIRSAEIGQVDQELGLGHIRPGLAQQPHRGAGGAAGRDQIVDQQDIGAGRAGIFMHRDPVSAIFQRIVLGDGRAGQLAVLADQQHAGLERHRQRGGEQEAACLDPRDKVDRPGRRRRHPFDALGKAMRVEQQRRDVAEHDSRLRKVGDRPDQRLPGVDG